MTDTNKQQESGGFLTEEQAETINGMILQGLLSDTKSDELDFKIEALRACLRENLRQIRTNA